MSTSVTLSSYDYSIVSLKSLSSHSFVVNDDIHNDIPGDIPIDLSLQFTNATITADKKIKEIHLIQTKKDILSKVTGRRNSIEQISKFLISNSVAEAQQNASLVIKSDQLKKRTGERPRAIEIQGIETHTIQETKEIEMNDYTINKKINKMTNYFGRRKSIENITDLLIAKDIKEATQNSIELRKYEKLKRIFGF